MLRVAADHGVFALLLGRATHEHGARGRHRHARAVAAAAAAGDGRARALPSPPADGRSRRSARRRARPPPASWAARRARTWRRSRRAARDDLLARLHVFEYFAQHPETARSSTPAAVINAGEPRALTEAYAFAGGTPLVDVGGGNGTLLRRAAASATRAWRHPARPPHGRANPATELVGVRGRVRARRRRLLRGGARGADAYLLTHIVHDWPEPAADAVLHSSARRSRPGGRLLLVEMVMPPTTRPTPAGCST